MEIVKKILFLGVSLYAAAKDRNEKLKQQFIEFFRKAGRNSDESAKRHKQNKEIRGDKEWKK